jgi:hypothetical protein
MSEIWGPKGLEAFECDECGKRGEPREPGNVYVRRPEGWITVVIYDKWFDGNEGSDPVLERNYDSVQCYNAGRHSLPVLPEDQP